MSVPGEGSKEGHQRSCDRTDKRVVLEDALGLAQLGFLRAWNLWLDGWLMTG